MNPLQEIIRARMAEMEWSFADVARRGKLPRSTVHHLATNPRPSRPHPQTLTRLAEGLGLPVEQVRAASTAATGYVVPAPDPELEVLLAGIARLGREDRRQVAGLVRALLERAEGGGGEFAEAYTRALAQSRAEVVTVKAGSAL